MRILYIHQYFTTREGGGGTRSYEFAKALLAAGHQVTMLCGSTARSATGLARDFERGMRVGRVDDIDVVEFDISYSNSDGLLARAWKFATFARRSAAYALTKHYDLVFATSTPLTAAIPGVAARLLRGKHFVFEVRDLWPELPRAMGMRNPLALGAMSAIEWLGYKCATRMVALAPGIADGIAKLGISRDRISMVPNGCDHDMFDGVQPLAPHEFVPQHIQEGDLVAMFCGAHGQANGLDAVVAAADVLKSRGRRDIKLLLVGDGAQKPALIQSAKEQGLDNLIFHPNIPKKDLVRLLKGVDIGMQILADVPAFYNGTSPNKFFDYLAAGKPVLINYPGWLAALVEQERCGFAVPPRNPEAFAEALIKSADQRHLLQQLGERAAALGRRAFKRSALARQFVDTLEAAAREAKT